MADPIKDIEVILMPDGLRGPAGKDAYELAVSEGFEGTLDEWLESIIGPEGKNAYELAVEEGFDGTLEEWLESLRGPKGDPGEPGPQGPGLSDEEAQEVLDEVDTLKDMVIGMSSGEGGNAYDSLADAVAAYIPDNVIFQTPEGIWRRDSSLPEGAEFLREFPATKEEAQDFAKEEVDKVEHRFFKEGYEHLPIDRPDLDPIFGGVIEVDKDNRIFEASISQKLLGNDFFDRPDLASVRVDKNGRIFDQTFKGVRGEPPTLVETKGYDRPDIEFAIIDKFNRIIFQPTPSEAVATSSLPDLYYNPEPQEPMEVYNTPFLTDYSVLESTWEGLLTEFPVNPDLDPYITRTNLGKTSIKDLDIWRFDFKPKEPKHKVILMAGTHASEKVYIRLLYDFCRLLADPQEWSKDATLQWLRMNVHFIVIPCVSPSSLTGLTSGTIGGRRIWECEDFPVTWTKNGTEVTITYNEVDFPDTGGRLDSNNYFGGAGLAGNVQVGLISSSDETGMPNDGYYIKSVVDGKTIVIDTGLSGGASSGTARLYVSVDPNRNYDHEWVNFKSQTTRVQYSNDHVPFPNDNKGTKPFSLSETIILRDLFDQENDFDFTIDEHAGAGRHYLSYAVLKNIQGIPEAIERMKNYVGLFTEVDFSQLRTRS